MVGCVPLCAGVVLVYPLCSKLIIEFTRTVCGGINQLNILIWSLGFRLTLHLLLMTGYSLWKLIQPKLEKTVGNFSPVLGSIRSPIPMVSQWFPQLQCFNVSRDNGWKMLCQTWRKGVPKNSLSFYHFISVVIAEFIKYSTYLWLLLRSGCLNVICVMQD